MKKIWIASLLCILLLNLLLPAAFAEDTGVVILSSGEEEEPQSVELDDLKLNATVELPGLGEFTLTIFKQQDEFRCLDNGDYRYYGSGSDADYGVLAFQFLNTTTKPLDLLQLFSDTKVIFKDKVEYGTWGPCQYDSNNEKYIKGEGWAIDPYYVGYYCLNVTLPNYVFDDTKSPLRIEFKIGDNAITHHVRK